MWDLAEYRRWFGQAEHTLASARRDAEGSDYSWACFKAEQAAQLALKALLIGQGVAAFGHSTRELVEKVRGLGLEVPHQVEAAARGLERHYIPSRYPDAYPSGSPYQFYDREDAERALEQAQAVLDFVRGAMADAT
ncbi:TPA: HEPN domain-containing protein [Candidatus Bipolaricaulota bacterium]|nr:HEPN domain-containing protein [Candidatus Bipolaricaulota bacterium]